MLPQKQENLPWGPTVLCYAIVPPGRRSGFRAEFRPDSNGENIKIGPSADRPSGRPKAGRRADFEIFLIRIRPGSRISGPEAVLRNICKVLA